MLSCHRRAAVHPADLFEWRWAALHEAQVKFRKWKKNKNEWMNNNNNKNEWTNKWMNEWMTKNVWRAQREGLTPLADWSALPMLSSSVYSSCLSSTHSCRYVSQHLYRQIPISVISALTQDSIPSMIYLLVLFLSSDWSFNNFLPSMFALLLDEHENRTERHDSGS